jgi:hypothetical protein
MKWHRLAVNQSILRSITVVQLYHCYERSFSRMKWQAYVQLFLFLLRAVDKPSNEAYCWYRGDHRDGGAVIAGKAC